MSRKPIIAGNWKMNKTLAEAKAFAEAVKGKAPSADLVETVIGSPALFLAPLAEILNGDVIEVAAQNAYFENAGAFTGENSPAAIADLGIKYIIIGHSERREYFHETDEDINKKAKAIIANGVTPIICCGETLETYEAGQTAQWVESQITAALKDLTPEQVSNLVIAYEPIWAIGTGKSADANTADETCGVVRNTVEKLYGKTVSDAVRIQYGGSVKPENVAEYMSKENVDGALVGGASLEAESFLALLDFVN
ncbi:MULTISPECIES: triose-phosphate isomerase [Pseudolactococcus]|uniref:Triosephosphate isomerase n=2 Tax=Pseudolactococcus TaxID=3436058 RepID=A0A7L4WGX6_9LACT|nr:MULTISPECIES: triose-phosphate isomerase [Lactococcus]MCJ1978336.1 triose-phosphate isomerase [Lactococcus paracarnosus]MCJ1984447.1 triose-phosphate isomerase [Lactococcus paracarnosus]MCJ1993326.1 triose-phosphate isomerase [Lactococcus paracarnosus]MCJ1996428.1 triose-phosphate isomerase [Lactococcus carnosus]MCJ1999168.1 triose-phosphate isomerase [Lactococcus paracarnosus]